MGAHHRTDDYDPTREETNRIAGSGLRVLAGIVAVVCGAGIVLLLINGQLSKYLGDRGGHKPAVACGKPTATAPAANVTVANVATKDCGKALSVLGPMLRTHTGRRTTGVQDGCVVAKSGSDWVPAKDVTYCFAGLKGARGVFAVLPPNSGFIDPAGVPLFFAQRVGKSDWIAALEYGYLVQVPVGRDVDFTSPNVHVWRWVDGAWVRESKPNFQGITQVRRDLDIFLAA